MINAPPVILGTSSSFRQSLFKTHFPDLPFTIASPSIDEKSVLPANAHNRATCDPNTLTLAVAYRKADALKNLLTPHNVLITCDQVVTYDGMIREKPPTAEICREYLRSYAHKPLVTVSALVVTTEKEQVEVVDKAELFFNEIPDKVIEKLIERGDVMYCSGGITAEDELLEPYRKELRGSMDSIMGLPVQPLKTLLRQVGFET